MAHHDQFLSPWCGVRRSILSYPWGGGGEGGGKAGYLFFNKNWHTFDTNDNKGNFFQFQRTKSFVAVVEKVHLAGVQYRSVAAVVSCYCFII